MIDEIEIKRFIRKILEKEIKLGSTALHSQVKNSSNGKFGETAIWNVIKSMSKNGELTEELLENKRKFYSLTDIEQDIEKYLDHFFKDLTKLEDRLTKFHKDYTKPSQQSEINYMERLTKLTQITRELLKFQGTVKLVEGFPAFQKHKSLKALQKIMDKQWNSISYNAGHQTKQNSKFFQEIIWSIQGIQ